MNLFSNAKFCELQDIHGFLHDVLNVKSDAIIES
jgi:hypothetical protein